ncbi:MAG: pyridoxamine 5'-phosphate oxidase [Bacteroidetes bacterium]|nr:pyridoxamine 5'-phosphate oxidase [Bacteroidota bacterium]
MEKDLKHLRKDYVKHHLTEEEAGFDPYRLFDLWFSEAQKSEPEATAMVLSTCGDRPHSRVVLLKEVRDREFVFFSNYNSHKGRDIELNPHVSLLFFWHSLERQIRIDGIAMKVSHIESDNYFYSRPVESQIGAIASAQSDVISGRKELEDRILELSEYFRHHPIVRPEHWGGYAVRPEVFEFWQGRPSRLHDRIQFSRTDMGWKRERLSP